MSFWYEPLQTVSFWHDAWGGVWHISLSMDAVIYTNSYVLVPRFLLKNRLGSYVLAAIITNLVVITFLSVTQGIAFEVILPVRNPDGFYFHQCLFGHTYYGVCYRRFGGNFIVHSLAAL